VRQLPLSDIRAVRSRTEPHTAVAGPRCPAARCTHAQRATRSRTQETTGGPGLCGSCVDRLQVDLRGLLDIYQDAEHALTRPPTSLRQRVSGSRPVGIVLDERALAVRSEMTDLLNSWVRMIVDERRIQRSGERDVRSLLRFLAQHMDWLARHPAVADFMEEIARLIESSNGMSGPGPARLIPLGRCLRADCHSPLNAVIHAARIGGSAADHVSCESGHILPPRQWLLVADRMRWAAAADGAGERALERNAG